MKETDKLKIAQKNILRTSAKPKEYIAIKGYDFNKGVNYDELLNSFTTTGFQASNLGKAIEIIKKMREEKCTIFLGYTSNMVTSGLREVFRYLAEEKLVDIIVTTAGGIEEDLIKCFDDFMLGDFNADGAELREKGINRTGNIFVPNERYIKFEKFFIPFLEELNKQQKVHAVSDIITKLGEKINNKESIYYWCTKNNIPVFCPAFTDGSMGDMVYFFKYKHPEFKVDISDDIKKLNDLAITAKKTGIIILGSGMVKHHICNANMFRNGAEYAVYINNAQEFDGSDSGAMPEEAISWGKILPQAKHVKVFGDATIIFPLLVAKAFVDK